MNRVNLQLFALLMAGLGLQAQAAPPLLRESAAVEGRALAPPQVVRSRVVLIDRALLDAASIGDELNFNLFADASMHGRITRREPQGPGSLTISGVFDGGAGGWFIVAIEDDAVVANLWTTTNGVFQLRPDTNGGYLIEEIDTSKLGPCVTGPQHSIRVPTNKPGQPVQSQAHRGVQSCPESIDVLVLYTPKVRNALGGEQVARAFALASVASCNLIHENSDVEARMRLVHVAETSYMESPDLLTDLNRLRQNGDGYMDEVFDLRAQHGADLVALLVDSFSSSCGIGYLMSSPSTNFAQFAFSVSQINCALSVLTFSHELGHNLGCHHDWSDPSQGAYPYSHGLRFTGASGQAWRTVMAGSPGTRIPHFSNPLIFFDGVPTGVPEGQTNPADNARTINNTFAFASAFVPAALIDCNENGISDACDIITGESPDLNENGVPDECDAEPCPPASMTKIIAPDAEPFDRFGASVSLSDERMVIGSYLDDDAGSASGAAYVFHRFAEKWVLQAKLNAADPQTFHHFGRSVAISAGGDYILIGAYRDGVQISDAGAVYIFHWNGTQWVQDTKIVNPDSQQAEWFGWSVAWAGHEDSALYAVVGTPFDDEIVNDAGAVYVIKREAGGWATPVKLMAADSVANSWLGLEVRGSIDGLRVIGGAPSAPQGSLERAGAAYVFIRNGDVWSPSAELVADVPLEQARLGWSVAIDGDTAIAGALNDNEFGKRTGAVFVFDANTGAQLAKFRAADAGEMKQFGAAVALRQDQAVIGSIFDQASGAAPGSVYIFNRTAGVWTQQAKLTPQDGASYDQFGASVSIAPSADLALAGAQFDDHSGTMDGGSAFVFPLSIKRPDCNGNGVADDCDIANGTSPDANQNGVPDECEPTPCPADITGDGVVNVSDLLAVINNWGPCAQPCPPYCAADINDDCAVNVGDLLAVINSWGPCR